MAARPQIRRKPIVRYLVFGGIAADRAARRRVLVTAWFALPERRLRGDAMGARDLRGLVLLDHAIGVKASHVLEDLGETLQLALRYFSNRRPAEQTRSRLPSSIVSDETSKVMVFSFPSREGRREPALPRKTRLDVFACFELRLHRRGDGFAGDAGRVGVSFVRPVDGSSQTPSGSLFPFETWRFLSFRAA